MAKGRTEDCEAQTFGLSFKTPDDCEHIHGAVVQTPSPTHDETVTDEHVQEHDRVVLLDPSSVTGLRGPKVAANCKQVRHKMKASLDEAVQTGIEGPHVLMSCKAQSDLWRRCYVRVRVDVVRVASDIDAFQALPEKTNPAIKRILVCCAERF
eukprot:2983048-Amphidinium_carterae.1